MIHQWLSLMAIFASKPPPKPVQVCPAMTGDTLFHVLFVLAMLALLGVLGVGIWMFKTGRWLVAPYQDAPFSPGNFRPPAYQAPGMSNNPSVGSHSRNPVPSAPPASQPPVHYGPPPGPSPRPSPPIQPEPQDNLLRDTRWLRLAQDCAYLFDELDENMANFDAPRREVARHVETRLREMLVHSNVETIDHDPTFNENRHQLERPDVTAAPGTPIVSFVSPGFAVDRRVLRRAVVRVASEDEG